MSTSSNDSSSESPGGSSEDTTTSALEKEIKKLKEQLKELIKKHAAEMDKVEEDKRELLVKMKEAEENHKKTSDELEAAKSKVSELEEEIKKLKELVPPQASLTSSPPNAGSEKTPAKSPPSSIQSQGSLTAKELFPDSAKGEDGNTGEGHKSMTVSQKLELMVGKVENITKEVTKLKKDNEQLKKDNEQLKHDVKHVYCPLFSKKGEIVYRYIQEVRELKWTEKVSEGVVVEKYLHYYDPSKDADPNQDKCVKDHPLHDIARRCAGISTSEDEGHIYVALWKVDGKCKHYVGQAKDWRKRWQKEGKFHVKQIEKAVEYLPKFKSSELVELQHCEIAIGFAILNFKQVQETEQCDRRIVVVYKIQCSLFSKTDKVPKSYLNPYEQHFMNAFSHSDFKDTEKLNEKNANDDHFKSCDKCLFSGANIPCKQFLIKTLGFVEKNAPSPQGAEFQWFHIQDDASPVATCNTSDEHHHQKHPLRQTVQKAANISKSDSSTGAQVYIALISIADTYLHSIHVTKYPCTTETTDEVKDLLLKSDAKDCLIFNHMCHPDKQCVLELLSAIHHAAKPPATPIVSLYTVATVEGTPVVNDHDMRSVQQHFMNALDGHGLMEGGRSTLVNPLEGDDIIHSGDVCPFSSNIQLACSVHLTKVLELQKNPICSLRFIKETEAYECMYKVLTCPQPTHIVSLEYSQESKCFTHRNI